MTAEEKAKAYDKALERAKKQLKDAKVFDYKEGQIAYDIRTTTYAIFPELKESEDERIRKGIISGMKALQEKGKYIFADIPMDNVFAWLEKQKEQKPADLVEEKYIENRNDGTYTCATTNDGFDAFMDGFNKGYELGMKEQTQNQ